MSEITIKLILTNSTPNAISHAKMRHAKNAKVVVVAGQVDKDQQSAFMNREFLAQPRADIYGFLVNEDIIVNGALNMIISAFGDRKTVGAVYTDKFLFKEKGMNIPQFYPPFEVDSKFVCNPTIFVNGAINNPIFNEHLNYLRFFDALRKIGQASCIIHIPSFLTYSKFEPGNIDEELKHVWTTS